MAMSCGGCATGYLGDRGRDAADIFTLTMGIGSGVRARVGPVHVAAINNADLVGLRAGQWLSNGNDIYDNAELYAPLPILARWGGGQWRAGDLLRTSSRKGTPWWKRTDLFGRETFRHGPRSEAAFRGKEIDARSPLPIVVVDRGAPFYTEVEGVIGLLFSVRAGVNPGEFLDFLLGWATLDIYNDDLSRGIDHRPPPRPR